MSRSKARPQARPRPRPARGGSRAQADGEARLRRFVEFIRPRQPAGRGQAATRIVDELRGEAGDLCELLGFTYVGSPQKGTGLRRYDDGSLSIQGQDVDLGLTITGPRVAELVAVFGHLEQAFARCPTFRELASGRDYQRSRLSLRLAPVLRLRGLGEFLVSAEAVEPISTREQIEAVRRRTRASVERNPRVPFNDLVRLLKWWAHARAPAGVPCSVELERLAIAVFDRVGVDEGWLATLSLWFETLARLGVGEGVDASLRRTFADTSEALAAASGHARAGELGAFDELLASRVFGSAFLRGG